MTRLSRHNSLVFTNLHILKEDASSSLVLEGQQLLSVLPLLIAVLLEEMREAWKGNIISGEVEGLDDRKGGHKTVIREASPIIIWQQK